MVMLAKGFAEVPLPEERKPIPAGEYKCKVENLTYKLSKQGTDIIEVELVVTEGDQQGGKLWKYFQANPSKLFSRQMVKQFVLAIGLDPEVQESYETDNWTSRECICKVKKVYSEDYGESNEITWFSPLETKTKE